MSRTHHRTRAKRQSAAARDRRNPVRFAEGVQEVRSAPVANYFIKIGRLHYRIAVGQRPNASARAQYAAAVEKQAFEALRQSQAGADDSRSARRGSTAITGAVAAMLIGSGMMQYRQRQYTRQKAG